MKCINCNVDNKLIDRSINLGRCRQCSHEFVFEPTSMSAETRLTDAFFAKLISDVSANKTLFFTPSQLYYILEKRLRLRSRKSVGSNLIIYVGGGLLFILLASIMSKGFFKLSFDLSVPIVSTLYITWAISQIAQNIISNESNRRNRQNSIDTLKLIAMALILIGLPLSIFEQTVVGMVSSIILGISAAALALKTTRQQDEIFDNILIDREQFDRWLARWNSINNPPEKILPLPDNSNLPAAPNLEVTAYSFDRVVVCDTPEIAQLLISNNFHFEHNCAILTIDGYPQRIFTTTMEMLRRNPDLKVYALHDCSPNGIQLIHRLRGDDNWFPDLNTPIIDVGILPRQIIDNLDIIALQSPASAQSSQQLAPAFRASLNPAELSWLDAGCYLELESFSPRKLIRILQLAISGSTELPLVEGDDDVVGDSAGFYTIDSFG